MSYNCWFKLNGQDAATPSKSLSSFEDFQNHAGYPIVIGSCSPADIRKMSTIDWFANNVEKIYADTTAICSRRWSF
jgi:hypothetical protein